RTELAEREAQLRQQQLVTEVVKPAEAEAERVRVLALAEAEKMRIQAEAAASHNRVALDRMLIDQLPEIVRQAASGLAGANVTVLNGAEGIGEIASGLVGQGVAIFEALRAGVRQPAYAADGQETAASAEHPGIATARPVQET
ncbi:flotillin domain-containing protein, partial [Frankia sp. ACN1ag]